MATWGFAVLVSGFQSATARGNMRIRSIVFVCVCGVGSWQVVR